MTDQPFFGLTHGSRGTVITLKVSAGASRERIVGSHGDSLKLSVREPPERGRANRAVCRLLAGVLRVTASDLEIVSGAGSSQKRVLIRSLTPESVATLLLKSIEGKP